MVASEGFAEFLRNQLGPLGRITTRRMFGKTGVFCDGWACCGSCCRHASIMLVP